MNWTDDDSWYVELGLLHADDTYYVVELRFFDSETGNLVGIKKLEFPEIIDFERLRKEAQN